MTGSSLFKFNTTLSKSDWDRFTDKIHYSTDKGECWMWNAARTKAGYGQFSLNGRPQYAHRIMAEVFFSGQYPNGLRTKEFVCHRCDNPWCVNPSHLFVGNAKINTQDACKKGRIKGWNSTKRRCINGHEITGKSIRKPTGKARRYCKTCHSDRQKRYRQEKSYSG